MIQPEQQTGQNWNKRTYISYQFEVIQNVFTQVQDQSKIKFVDKKEK